MNAAAGVATLQAERAAPSRHLLGVEITRDTAPVLASGTAHGWGVALIVGTGSVAIGIDASGQSVTMVAWKSHAGDC